MALHAWRSTQQLCCIASRLCCSGGCVVFRRLPVDLFRWVVSDSGDGVVLAFFCPLRVGGLTLCPFCALHCFDVVFL